MEITIESYARGTQLTSQDIEDSDFTLVIDKANSFQFRVDDIETQQSHVNWLELAADRAAYRISDTYDEEVLGYLSGFELDSAGDWQERTTASGTKSEPSADSDELLAEHKLARDTFVSGASSSDSVVIGTSGTFDATALQVMNRINRLFDLQNVPKEGRWVVLDPVFCEILSDENSKFINNDYNPGADQLTNGKLTDMMIRGFRVYKSNNLPFVGTGPGTVDADGSSTNYGVIVAGHDSAVATAEQISKTESFRDPNSFGDITRGLHLYGRKILRPTGLARVIYNINA